MARHRSWPEQPADRSGLHRSLNTSEQDVWEPRRDVRLRSRLAGSTHIAVMSTGLRGGLPADQVVRGNAEVRAVADPVRDVGCPGRVARAPAVGPRGPVRSTESSRRAARIQSWVAFDAWPPSWLSASRSRRCGGSAAGNYIAAWWRWNRRCRRRGAAWGRCSAGTGSASVAVSPS
jgi:hypothetical protein